MTRQPKLKDIPPTKKRKSLRVFLQGSTVLTDELLRGKDVLSAAEFRRKGAFLSSEVITFWMSNSH